MTDLEPDDQPVGPTGERPGGGPRTALVIASVLGVLMVLLVGVLATRDPSTERVTQSPLIGKLAPAVAGATLDDRTFSLADQRGRWAIVNFFATWCTPCVVEHEELLAFDERHRPQGDAVVVSVLFDDDPDSARAFFDERGGTWPVVVDEEGAIGVAYGVARVPESFLVAPDGTVVQRLVGGVTDAQLEGLLDQYEAAAEGAGS
ncbi:MAG TPA: TlpA disulfide reductase family protein [Acidimicrobiales bacterium]|jgi:cytochrome c biogenesis protein CcmG/thiol:disulfide interchange protein DsbE|nr:TlpA disulfide reductase family protein [Acidimicrobiales bacterium]